MSLMASIVLAALGGCSVDGTQVAVPDRVYEAVITGMTCKGCAKEASDLLGKIENVKSVEVDLKSTKATITMKGNAALDRAAVEKALKGSKFGITSVEEKKAPASRPSGG